MTEDLRDLLADLARPFEDEDKGVGCIIVDAESMILYINKNNPFLYDPSELENIYELDILFDAESKKYWNTHKGKVRGLVNGNGIKKKMQAGLDVGCLTKPLDSDGNRNPVQISLTVEKGRVAGQNVGIGQYFEQQPKNIIAVSERQLIVVKKKWTRVLGVATGIGTLIALYVGITNIQHSRVQQKLDKKREELLREEKDLVEHQKNLTEIEEEQAKKLENLTKMEEELLRQIKELKDAK